MLIDLFMVMLLLMMVLFMLICIDGLRVDEDTPAEVMFEPVTHLAGLIL